MPVTLRLAAETDAEAILAIYAPIVHDSAISFETAAPSPQEMRDRVRTVLHRFPWIVCEIEGRIAGYAYATTFRTRAAYQWSVETTVYVHPAYHRRGVGRGLYTALLDALRSQGFFRAVAVITLPNAPSVALHEAVGFERMGVLSGAGFKHGAWHNVGYWALPLRASDSPPREIVTVGELVRTSAWADAVARGSRLVRGAS